MRNIGYDFDGVCHISMISQNSFGYIDPDIELMKKGFQYLKPNIEILNKIRHDLLINNVYIITHNDMFPKENFVDFFKFNNVNVNPNNIIQIKTKKSAFIWALNIEEFYDDSPKVWDDIENNLLLKSNQFLLHKIDPFK
jgi:hypothetical protein